MTKPCEMCGCTDEPVCKIEVMPDGTEGAGVYYECPNCGYVED